MKSILLALALLASAAGAAANEALPADSIYNLSSEWSDQNDKRLKLSVFRGQPTIISMAYTGCQFSCPIIISKLKKIDAALKKAKVGEYRFVIASFDAIKDRPERMKAAMKERGVDLPHWSFIVADDDSKTRELAVLLGISYERMADGEISHSNNILLLDGDGRVVQELRDDSDHAGLIKKMTTPNARKN